MTADNAVPVLRLNSVSKTFGAYPAVADVLLELQAGEVIALLGPSGCGKTTTLRIAAGLEIPEAGEVVLDGRTVAGPGVFVPPEKRHVGLMFQDFALFPHLDVRGNVAFGLRGLAGAEIQRRVDVLLEKIGLTALEKAYPHQLSGGEQQRIALARALAPEPAVLLMDEPFSGLDTRLREAVRGETLGILKDTGAAALFVTHEAEEAMQVSDRIVLMRAGRVIQTGTPADLYHWPVDREAAAFFSELNRFTGKVVNGKVGTPIGSVAANGLREGQDVDVCVRPEAFHLTGDNSGTEARIVHATFLGSICLIEASLGENIQIRARISPNSRIKPGDTVSLKLEPNAALVYPAP